MKKYCFIIAFIALNLWVACSSSNQAQSEKDSRTIGQINEKVQGKDYQINVNFANPMRGKSISLSYGYNLVVRNDSAFAYLPYYGVAYSAPYGGGDGGIKFAQPMKDYQAIPQKKAGEWKITFKTNTSDYNYDVNIDIYSNGKANLYFNSSQRQPINFSGEMDL